MNITIFKLFLTFTAIAGISTGVATYFLSLSAMAALASPQLPASQIALVPAGLVGIGVTAFLLAIALVPHVKKT